MAWCDGLLLEASDGRCRFLVGAEQTALFGRMPARPPRQFGIPDRLAAAEHLRITGERGTYWLENLDPAGATWVNGVPLVGVVAIAPGDEVRVGHSLLLHLQAVQAESLWDRAGTAPLSLTDGLRIGLQVATSLARLHALGLVHGGLTPHDIQIDRGGTAKLLIPGQHIVDETGTLQGNPQYCAPELCRDGKLLAASDVYSLGLVLYEALTGQVAFARDNVQQTMMAKLFGDLPPLPSAWPRELAGLLQQLLQVEPAQRPGAAELVQRLAILERWAG